MGTVLCELFYVAAGTVLCCEWNRSMFLSSDAGLCPQCVNEKLK